jgi:hypothetical protein
MIRGTFKYFSDEERFSFELVLVLIVHFYPGYSTLIYSSFPSSVARQSIPRVGGFKRLILNVYCAVAESSRVRRTRYHSNMVLGDLFVDDDRLTPVGTIPSAAV